MLIPLSEVKNNLWSLCYSISPYLRKTTGYCLGWIGPLIVVGSTKVLILIGSKTLIDFRGKLLRRNSSISLTS